MFPRHVSFRPDVSFEDLERGGLKTLEKLRFDERTRVTGKSARGLLADIEAEMAGNA